MSNNKFFHLFPNGKDIAAMQQSESFLVPPKPDSPDSSSSPHHQDDNEYKKQLKHQHQQQDKDKTEEQEKLEDGSKGKRKWECVDEASYVEIPQTTRISSSVRYCPPRPPKKPKTSPALKWRAMWVKRSVVFLDVAREVDSMFPPSVLQDFGKKIKKARF